jgi:AcrR family transcriptional regulator
VNARQVSTSRAGYRKDNRGRPSIPFLRERILHSATVLFAEKEFDQVLIDDVAAHADVGKGSVYRQCGSKEELYAAVVINGFMQLQQEIRAALIEAKSLHDQISAIVHHVLSYFWGRRQFFALMRDPQALPRRQEQEYRAQRHEVARLIGDVLADGIRNGAIKTDLDTRLAAESLLGMLRGVNRYCREYTTPDVAIGAVTSIFLEGCTAKNNAANGKSKRPSPRPS